MAALSQGAEKDLVATRQAFTRAAAKQLWEHYDRAWSVSRERAEYARGVLDGKVKAEVPQEIEYGRQMFEQRSPESVTVPLHTLNLLTSKWPKLKRGTTAVGLTAQTVTSRIEALANAQFMASVPWAEAMGYLLNEAHVAMAIIPTRAYALRTPEYLDDKGEPKSEWRRDATGRAPYDDGYEPERLDMDRTRKAYEHARTEFHAANSLSVVEVYGRTEAVPINLRYVGRDLRLDGLITARRFSKTELIRDHGFVWANMGGPQKSPSEDDSAECTLVSVWRCDDDGPYVAYCVDGEDTWRVAKGDRDSKYVDAVMDLREYGLDELPVTWQMGWHFSRRDLDKAGVPFPWVFGPNWATTNAIISALTYRHWQFSYLAPVLELSESDAVLARLEGDLLRNFQLKPMTITTVPGKLQPPVTTGTGPDAQMLLSHLMGANEREQTPVAAHGGPGATGYSDRMLSSRQAMDAMGQVLDAGLALARFAGRIQNKIYDGTTQARGEPMPIRANADVPPGGSSTATKAIFTVPHDMFGGVYDMDAEYPRNAGENLPQVQQWLEIFSQGGMDYFEFRELAFGDTAPDVSLARKVAWEYLNSPEGRMELQAGIAEYSQDQRMKAILAMQSQGRANRSGLPTALGDGTGEPPLMGSPTEGALGLGNPAQSALGGIVGGAMAGERMAIPSRPTSEMIG